MAFKLLIFSIAVLVALLIFTPTIIWFFLMRPYIRKKGKHPAAGANWWFSQLLDFSMILSICSEEKTSYPWFIYAWVITTIVLIISPVLALIAPYILQN